MGRHRGAKGPYFRVAGERSSLVEAPPTDFPDSLWKNNSRKFAKKGSYLAHPGAALRFCGEYAAFVTNQGGPQWLSI